MPEEDGGVYQEHNPIKISIFREEAFVSWEPFLCVQRYWIYKRVEGIKDLRSRTWCTDRYGDVFVRCTSCGKIYRFNLDGIHPTGPPRLHYDSRLGRTRDCHMCPYCGYPIYPYFEGWEECQGRRSP